MNGVSTIRWGVLGGMGPLASAEFLKTIYEIRPTQREQDLPVVFVISDPSFPDRTESFTNGTEGYLIKRLSASLRALLALGAQKIVICCVTIHYLLPFLDSDLQDAVVSIPDVLLAAANQIEGRHLLMCTKGARESRLFENHPLWNEASKHICLPGRQDQERIHGLIYQIKSGICDKDEVSSVLGLLYKYRAGTFLAGCTELHILSKYMRQRNLLEICIDPIEILARRITNG